MDRTKRRDIQSYRDLVVWQKAMELVRRTYEETSRLPDCERYGFVTEMRRSARSVPSNIAEGSGRHTQRDYIRFLQIARGSANELSTQSEMCLLVQYCGCWDELMDRAEEVGRLLNGLIASIRRRAERSTR